MDSQFLRRRIGLIGALIVLAVAAVIAVLFLTRQSAKPAQTAEEEQVAEREGEEEFGDPDADVEGKYKRMSGVREEVVNGPAAGPTGFSPQTRLGFTVGDQWEPAIAADRFGHVYVLYDQYGGIPGCGGCPDPNQVLTISSDGGNTWSAPVAFQPSGGNGQQWDSQLVVDPVDGSTVYASWMENAKADIMVGKSTDFGQTWTAVRANSIKSGTDKPVLAVRGQDVYVAYNHTNTIWMSSSHDGGQTFTTSSVKTQNIGWSLPGGGTVTSDGSVYFSFDGYQKSGSATGPVNLYVTKSSDGGATWTLTQIDKSGPPPDCSAYLCGWAYLGAAITMTSDSANNLYLLWNAGPAAGGPERIYFSKSTNGGASWSPKVDVSTAAVGVDHNFPAIAAGANGDVRIAWMDNRNSHNGTPAWNVYYRTSTNGGNTWSAERDISISTDPTGYDYIWSEGFSYPFGDYFEIDIDGAGNTHAVFGEGLNYDSPGSIWYTKGK